MGEKTSSYDDVISSSDDFLFLVTGSMYCKTNESRVYTAKGTMLKNKPHLIAFPDNILVSL